MPTVTTLPSALPTSVSDAQIRVHLADSLKGKLRSLSIEAVVDHICTTTPVDFDARMGAAEAIVRRLQKAALEKPKFRRHALGRFSVKAEREYLVRFSASQPFEGSCSCPDFIRNGLATCKHLLWLWHEGRASRGRLPDVTVAFRGVRHWSEVDRPVDRLTFEGQPLVVAEEPAARAKALGALLKRVERGTVSADPASVVVLASLERDATRQAFCAAQLLPKLSKALEQLKKRLLPYQSEAVRQFATQGRLLLADDMGLGKTAQAIACVHLMTTTGIAKRTLLIVPSALKVQWLQELRAFTDCEAINVEGSASERRARYAAAARGILVVGYEQYLRDHLAIEAWAPDFVVLDEAQRIKNWAAKTSQLVKSLKPSYRMVLTGTPFENRLEELASVVEWVDDAVLEPKWRLSCGHAVRVDGVRPVAGAKNLTVLRERLRPILVRRTRQAVLPQLPSRSDWPQLVEMTEAQSFEHDLLRNPILELMARRVRRPLLPAEFFALMQLLTRQRMISNGLALAQFEQRWPALSEMRPTDELLQSLDSPKLTRFRELVHELVVEGGRKIVVFSQWRRMLELARWSVSDLLESKGLSVGFFSGQEKVPRRNENLVRFHDDDSMRILFCTDAGGVGLNLQRAASCLLNLEYPWNPAVLEQRIGRIHRMGQPAPIDVYLLGSSEGIEANVARTLRGKSALFKGLFEGSTDEVPFSEASHFMARLEQVVEVPEETEAAAEVEEKEPDAPDVTSPVVVLSDDAPVGEPGVVKPRVEVHSAPAALTLSPALLAGLRVTAQNDGGLLISAPPEAAHALAQLFAGLAQALSGAATTPPVSPETTVLRAS